MSSIQRRESCRAAPGAAEEHARREVLDLALAVDRRIRHDGDCLLKMIGRFAQARSHPRPVITERSDRLVARLDHERRHLRSSGSNPSAANCRSRRTETSSSVRARTDLPALGCGDRLGRPTGGEIANEFRS